MPTRTRRLVAAAVAATLLPTGLAGAQESSASPPGVPAESAPWDEGPTVEELQAEVARAEEEATRAQTELEATSRDLLAVRDELLALQQRLDDATAQRIQLEGQVELAERELDAARDRLGDAEANELVAERLLDRARQDLDTEAAALEDQVAAAWKYGSSTETSLLIGMIREAKDPTSLAVGLHQLESMVSWQADLLGSVEDAEEETADQLGRTEDARDVAAANRAAAQAALDLLEELTAEQRATEQRLEDDEARQRELVLELEEDEQEAAAVLVSLEAEQALAGARLAEERQRIAALGDGCPVPTAQVGRDFVNDWGFPRSGGRRHEGTDVFGARGTPVRSVTAGTVKEVRPVESGRGGRVVSIWAGPDEYWYYAHLEAVAPGLAVGQQVVAGQLLGTVGTSGNARGTPPHLHIGHYVRGSAVPPYPVLAERCR